MQVIAIGGVPGSGKTTSMRRIIEQLGMGISFKTGLVVGTEYPKYRALVLGDYNTAETFAGTDKLSMAAQPKVLQFLAANQETYDVVLLEGDRLFTQSFFRGLEALGIEFDIFVLKVSPELQAARLRARGSNQPKRFLDGRQTKIQNIANEFPVVCWRNDTEADLAGNLSNLLSYVGVGG